jgi:succinate dehydrogenase/fumarate reductase flavoprotein subunit
MGAYVLPMPEGHDVKKVLYRQLKRAQVKINNRIVTTKLLKNEQGRLMVYSVLTVVLVSFM